MEKVIKALDEAIRSRAARVKSLEKELAETEAGLAQVAVGIDAPVQLLNKFARFFKTMGFL